MKIILLRDVAKIGKKFAIVQVPDGYALNKLIPQKDAEPASPANVKRILEKKKNDSQTAEAEVTTAAAIPEAFATEELIVTMEANEQGHLFQAVHPADIVAAAKLRGVVVPERFLSLPKPIKSVGVHEVLIEAGKKALTLPITVVAKNK